MWVILILDRWTLSEKETKLCFTEECCKLVKATESIVDIDFSTNGD